jgi:hypothetical protein
MASYASCESTSPQHFSTLDYDPFVDFGDYGLNCMYQEVSSFIANQPKLKKVFFEYMLLWAKSIRRSDVNEVKWTFLQAHPDLLEVMQEFHIWRRLCSKVVSKLSLLFS